MQSEDFRPFAAFIQVIVAASIKTYQREELFFSLLHAQVLDSIA
jgi:hypothetical protein